MATISGATLAIAIPDVAVKKARVKVTCSLNFTKYELNEMREGLVFRFRCALYGLDWFGTREVFITQLGQQYITGAVASPKNVSYEKTVDFSVLNEDPTSSLFENSLDELVGKCILENTYTGRVVSVRTNQINYEFGS